jgi:SAM-dependent methyltransferase
MPETTGAPSGVRRAILATILLVGWLASSGAVVAEGPSAAPRFPAPARPVAGIVAPSYSDEESRDRRGEGVRVLNRLGLGPAARVADIGAGDGYYTVRLARRPGRTGAIYAEDIRQDYLQRLEARLRRENISGVAVVLGEPRDPKLPRATIDVVILAHVYHEIENPYELLWHLRASLAPGARVAIIDVDKPTQDHGTPPALLRCELAAVGYREVDFISLAPADGYLAVFVPPDTLPAPEAIRACRP